MLLMHFVFSFCSSLPVSMTSCANGHICLLKEMTTQLLLGILAWEIPLAEEPGGPQSIGWQRVGHDQSTEQSRSEWNHFKTRVPPSKNNKLLHSIRSQHLSGWAKSRRRMSYSLQDTFLNIILFQPPQTQCGILFTNGKTGVESSDLSRVIW